jgi:Zn-dependent protease
VGRYLVRIGRVFGVQIGLHFSWFPVVAAVAILAAVEFGRVYPDLTRGVRLGMGGATGLAFFGCILAHELSHAVVARRRGVPVRGITLFMFGGVAEIGGEAQRPGDEFAIALVGPVTSILLAGLFAAASVLATRAGSVPVEGVTTVLAVSNLVVAAFNLIPGLPLDGGRLLRAGIWRATGSYRRATRMASIGGAVVSLLLTGVGVFLVVTGTWAGAWYVVVGWFLGRLALASARRAAPQPPALAWKHGEGQAPQPRS